VAVFAFDNSSNHAAFRKDALVASRMNLNPGGKQPIMRNTYFGPNNQLQSMVFSETHHVENFVVNLEELNRNYWSVENGHLEDWD
jgi:hypothetical protein